MKFHSGNCQDMKFKLHMDVKLPYIHMSPLEQNIFSFNYYSLLNNINSYSILWKGGRNPKPNSLFSSLIFLICTWIKWHKCQGIIMHENSLIKDISLCVLLLQFFYTRGKDCQSHLCLLAEISKIIFPNYEDDHALISFILY